MASGPSVTQLTAYYIYIYNLYLYFFVPSSTQFEPRVGAPQDPEQPMFELLQTSRGMMTIVSSLLAVVAMIPFLYMEVWKALCLLSMARQPLNK